MRRHAPYNANKLSAVTKVLFAKKKQKMTFFKLL